MNYEIISEVALTNSKVVGQFSLFYEIPESSGIFYSLFRSVYERTNGRLLRSV